MRRCTDETTAPTADPRMAPPITSVAQCRSATIRSRLVVAAIASAPGHTTASAPRYNERRECCTQSTDAAQVFRWHRCLHSPRRLADCARDADIPRRRNQIVAAIFLPSFLTVAGDARTLLAVADRRDARCVQPEVHEIVLCSLGASLAKRQVVLAGAALVAVPLDADVLIGPLPRLIEE